MNCDNKSCVSNTGILYHLSICNYSECTEKKCLDSRLVLEHYINCKNLRCKTCPNVSNKDIDDEKKQIFEILFQKK